MIIIYSEKEVKGIGGVYCDPRLFDGVADKRAKLVYTSSKTIADVYKNVEIEVKALPRGATPQSTEEEK